MADDLPALQQTVDEFRSLASQLQADAQNIIDPQAIEFVTTVVDQSARLSREQRNFVFELGREAVIADSLTQFKERQILLSELEGTLDDAQREHKSTLLELTETQIQQNNELLQNLQSQAVERGRILGYGKDLTEEQSELLSINLELAKLDVLRSGLSDGEIAKAENHLDLRKKIATSLSTEAEHQKKLSAQQEAMGTLLGFNLEDIKGRSLEIGDLFKTTLGRLTAAAIVLKMTVGKVVSDMQIVHDAGFGIAQTWQLTRDYALDFSGYMERFQKFGILTGTKAIQEATRGIAGAYGDIADVTDENVAQSLILTRNLSMTAQEAAAFVQAFEKTPGYTEGMTEDFITTTRMLAQINRIAPEKIFSEIADNVALFAKYGIDGADAMARAVVSASKMGVELSSIEAFADEVLNIDTFIQDVTKLRTLGINIEDPMRLAQLSQQGDREGFMQELQTQIQGIGRQLTIEDLGRVQLNALVSTFGIPLEELQRIQVGADINNVEALTSAEKIDLERNQKIETTIGSMAEIAGNINVSNLLLGGIATLLAFNAGGIGRGLFGGIKNKFGRGKLGPRMAPIGGRGLIGRVGGAIAGGATAAGRGIEGVGSRAAGGLASAGRGVAAAGGTVGRGAGAVAGFGRGIPIIGAAAGLGIDLARGEKLGRAGSAAAGAATGAAIGSIVPGIGTVIGAIAGGIIGRVAGQKIYDAVTDIDLEPKAQPLTLEEIIARPDVVQRTDIRSGPRPLLTPPPVIPLSVTSPIGAPQIPETERIVELMASAAPIMPGVEIAPIGAPQIPEAERIVEVTPAPAPIMPGLARAPTDRIDQTDILSLATIVQQMQREREDYRQEEQKEIEVDLGGVESRLDELTNLFETGKIAVVMDGRKVGRIMMNSYSRNVTA